MKNARVPSSLTGFGLARNFFSRCATAKSSAESATPEAIVDGAADAPEAADVGGDVTPEVGAGVDVREAPEEAAAARMRSASAVEMLSIAPYHNAFGLVFAPCVCAQTELIGSGF